MLFLFCVLATNRVENYIIALHTINYMKNEKKINSDFLRLLPLDYKALMTITLILIVS